MVEGDHTEREREKEREAASRDEALRGSQEAAIYAAEVASVA